MEHFDRILLSKDSIETVYDIARRELTEENVRLVCLYFACISGSSHARKILRVLVGDHCHMTSRKNGSAYRVSLIFLVGFARRVGAKYGDEHYLTRLCVLVSHLYSWRHHSFWKKTQSENPTFTTKPDDALLHMHPDADLVDFYGTFRVVFG